jgi:hypothetical protein
MFPRGQREARNRVLLVQGDKQQYLHRDGQSICAPNLNVLRRKKAPRCRLFTFIVIVCVVFSKRIAEALFAVYELGLYGGRWRTIRSWKLRI